MQRGWRVMLLTWFDPHLPLLALSRSPGSRALTLSQDLDTIEEAGIQHIICLQETFELEMLGESIEQRREAVEARGLVFTHEPIEDFTAPTTDQVHRLTTLIELSLDQDHRVLVHCQAGLGRAGTIAACLLVKQGMSGEDAIATTRYFRMGAIQSEPQERCIITFAKHVERA